MNFNNFSCLTFVLKCTNIPKPKNTPGGENVLVCPYCKLLESLELLYQLKRIYVEN